jgi:hypothetical protein
VRTGTLLLAVGLPLLAGGAGRTGMPPAGLPPDLAQRASVIRPRPDELRWQQIPWITDLSQGARIARDERRPILLWVTGDDPLERC